MLKIIPRPAQYFRVLLLALLLLMPLTLAAEDQVYFNVETHKVHKMTCEAGQRCTRNCILVPRHEAYRRGGLRCKICGG